MSPLTFHVAHPSPPHHSPSACSRVFFAKGPALRRLDDVRLWSSASPTVRYDEPVPRDAASLVAYFTFDELGPAASESDVLTDRSAANTTAEYYAA